MVVRWLGWLWRRGNRTGRYAKTMASGTTTSPGTGPSLDGERNAPGPAVAREGSPAKLTAARFPPARDDAVGDGN